MTGDSFDHLVVASSQIQFDRRVFSQTVCFVVARLLVFHLFLGRAHFFRDYAITYRSALSIGGCGILAWVNQQGRSFFFIVGFSQVQSYGLLLHLSEPTVQIVSVVAARRWAGLWGANGALHGTQHSPTAALRVWPPKRANGRSS
jgi:hypothetical protein